LFCWTADQLSKGSDGAAIATGALKMLLGREQDPLMVSNPECLRVAEGRCIVSVNQPRLMVRIVSVLISAFFGFAFVRGAEPPVNSIRHYSLYGELSYSFFKGTRQTVAENLQCEVLRDGDRLRITTSVCNSNFPANVFICDATKAFTYVQYRAEEPSNSLEIVPNPDAATNGSPKGQSKLVLHRLSKSLKGWCVAGGMQWKSFRPVVADEKTVRENPLNICL
jgi:hypothetical protein